MARAPRTSAAPETLSATAPAPATSEAPASASPAPQGGSSEPPAAAPPQGVPEQATNHAQPAADAERAALPRLGPDAPDPAANGIEGPTGDEPASPAPGALLDQAASTPAVTHIDPNGTIRDASAAMASIAAQTSGRPPAGFVRVRHPDGGSISLGEVQPDGTVIIPEAALAEAQAHGFVRVKE